MVPKPLPHILETAFSMPYYYRFCDIFGQLYGTKKFNWKFALIDDLFPPQCQCQKNSFMALFSIYTVRIPLTISIYTVFLWYLTDLVNFSRHSLKNPKNHCQHLSDWKHYNYINIKVEKKLNRTGRVFNELPHFKAKLQVFIAKKWFFFIGIGQ